MGTDQGETTHHDAEVEMDPALAGRASWRDGHLTDGFGDQTGYGAVPWATV